MQGDAILISRGEQLVLDHLRRHAHQRHGVAVEAVAVARDVEHADHRAARIEDGRSRAGEDVVGLQIMLVGVHQRRRAFRDRGADGVRAAPLFGPRHAGRQRDAVGALDEIVVAQRMHDHALRIGQDHHVGGVDDLLVQRLHHRQRVGVEHAVLIDDAGKVGLGERTEIGVVGGVEAVGCGALMRLFYHGPLLGCRKRAKRGSSGASRPVGAVQCGMAHAGPAVVSLTIFHVVSSFGICRLRCRCAVSHPVVPFRDTVTSCNSPLGQCGYLSASIPAAVSCFQRGFDW